MNGRFNQLAIAETPREYRPPDNPGGVGAWNDYSATASAARQSLREAAGVEVPDAGFVVLCLTGYLAALVPLNWLIFRTIGRIEWAWIAAPIIAPDAQRITLVAMKTPPQPQGKAFYLRNSSNLVFVANNMPALPPQKAYELWLIPTQGAPIPAGVFKPDARGSATVVNPPLPVGTEAKAFAITVENEAGATSPTMPIVMMGTGE